MSAFFKSPQLLNDLKRWPVPGMDDFQPTVLTYVSAYVCSFVAEWADSTSHGFKPILNHCFFRQDGHAATCSLKDDSVIDTVNYGTVSS